MARYAPNVHVTFVCDDDERVTEAELSPLGEPEIDAGNGAVRLRVARGEVTQVARELLNRYRLSNLLVEEPSLEEVVTALVGGHAR